MIIKASGFSPDSPPAGQWFRNPGRATRYHLARPDWVRSGLAVCGADISAPTYTLTAAAHPTHPKCKRCLKKEAIPCQQSSNSTAS